MIWFDQTAMFKRRFERTEGGYLYYPRTKGGGKLISEPEYERIIANHRRWMGSRFRPGLLIGVMFGVIAAVAVASAALDLPEKSLDWSTWPLVIGCVCAIFWIQSAPRRLVGGRPDVTPPRTKVVIARTARATVPWFILSLIVLVFGALAVTAIIAAAQDPSIGIVAFAIFFVVGFIQSIRMAGQKLRDGRAERLPQNSV